jgi:hypothetical protein
MIAVFAVLAAVMITAGAVLGILVMVSVGVRREKKAGRRLGTASPSPLASGVRAVTALSVRRPNTTSNY